MRVNKSFCVHSLWVASIIFFILRIMYVIGIPLSEAMFLLFFKILLIWSAGGDRQELHERIRELSMEAGRNVKEKGLDNNLLELIAADPAFNLTLEDLQKTMKPEKYVGRASEQVDAYLQNVIRPLLEKNKEILGVKAEINV